MSECKNGKMKNVLVIIGSHRTESNSAKVASWIGGRIGETAEDAEISFYDLGKNPLPMWDERIWQKDEEWMERLRPLHESASQADAFVCVVPEYAGMAAPAFKNLMLMLSGEHVGHKPALLVGVSSGFGGSYPVAELRLSSFKNNRLLWIPDHVIVRFAETFVPPFEDKQHKRTAQRLEHSLEVLAEYARALKQVRESGVLERQPFPFGM